MVCSLRKDWFTKMIYGISCWQNMWRVLLFVLNLPTYYYRSNQSGIMQGGQNSDDSYLPVVSLLSRRISGLNPCREIEFLGNLIFAHNIDESYYIDNFPSRKFLVRHLFFIMNKRKCSKLSFWGIYSRIAYKVVSFLINTNIK